MNNQRSMTPSLPQSSVPRISQLDGLRGLAAVTVLLLHILLAFRHRTAIWLLALFFSGSQAVILFFVLSGFVLSLPFWAGKKVKSSNYLLARTARIYLPFFVAAVISILGAYLVRNRPLHLTFWFNQTWQTPVTLQTAFDQFTMWPVGYFNTALWSLRYEMQASLLFPLLMWIGQRVNMFVVAGIAITIAFYNPPRLSQMLGWHVMYVTVSVLALFLVGACAARYQQSAVAALRSSTASRWVLCIASFLLYNRTMPFVAPNSEWLACAFAAVGLILTSLASRRATVLLSSAPCAYLGRISYSLYLTHSVVLFSLTYLFYGHIPVPVLCAAIVVISFVTAHIFNVLIELPSMRLSRYLLRARLFHFAERRPKPAESVVAVTWNMSKESAVGD